MANQVIIQGIDDLPVRYEAAGNYHMFAGKMKVQVRSVPAASSGIETITLWLPFEKA